MHRIEVVCCSFFTWKNLEHPMTASWMAMARSSCHTQDTRPEAQSSVRVCDACLLAVELSRVGLSHCKARNGDRYGTCAWGSEGPADLCQT